MPKNKETTTSEFYCVHCGNQNVPIARKIGKQREAGHLKKLYCIHCKETWNCAEVRPFGEYNREDFEFEFHYGNFDEEGNRIMPYKQFEHKKMLELERKNIEEESENANE
jgi:hypothetical protein